MKHLCYVVAVGGLLASIGGCASSGQYTGQDTDVQPHMTDYQATWDAVHQVMSDHFLVSYANRHEGVVVAAPLKNDGRMGKAETRVKARIVPAKYGYDVEIRAENWIDVSQPRVLGKKTAPYEWVNVAFDDRLEAALRNEIDEHRFGGRTAREQNMFLESPRESVPAPPGN